MYSRRTGGIICLAILVAPIIAFVTLCITVQAEVLGLVAGCSWVELLAIFFVSAFGGRLTDPENYKQNLDAKIKNYEQKIDRLDAKLPPGARHPDLGFMRFQLIFGLLPQRSIAQHIPAPRLN